MHGVGLRELVALGILGLALGFGFMFFDPTSTGNDGKWPATVSLGEPVPTRDPSTPAATATPVPVRELKEPGGSWFLSYYARSSTGSEFRAAQGFVERLAIDEAGKPFPDFTDDAWRVEASQQLTLEPGRYRFGLETDGAVTVMAGDKVVLEAQDSATAQRREVIFDHAGGSVVVLINARDMGGPLRLKWAE
ncbi:MAG: hypothetical protein IPN07_00530 [Dehalococcoidia bacterium]|nr:hypothetical protein [Dehalococcoidia bacterium]